MWLFLGFVAIEALLFWALWPPPEFFEGPPGWPRLGGHGPCQGYLMCTKSKPKPEGARGFWYHFDTELERYDKSMFWRFDRCTACKAEIRSKASRF